jgi:hypothetical protein
MQMLRVDNGHTKIAALEVLTRLKDSVHDQGEAVDCRGAVLLYPNHQKYHAGKFQGSCLEYRRGGRQVV